MSAGLLVGYGDKLFIEPAPAPSMLFPGKVDFRRIVLGERAVKRSFSFGSSGHRGHVNSIAAFLP
jgi:hypothetical protein